jgi:amino acid adenylation domain-containing protein
MSDTGILTASCPPPLRRRGTGQAVLPMSFAQEQLWFIDEFHRGLAAHNVPHLIRLNGTLQVTALHRALDGLVSRHEILRTRMLAGSDGQPGQVVDPPAEVRLELYELADPEPARLREFAIAQSLRPFDLARDHLLRCHLLRLAPDEHVLLVVSHQLAFDDCSLRVLLTELAALYGQEAGGEQAGLPELPVQFADYASWERQYLAGPVLAGLTDYWRGVLAGAEASRFPADRPRPLFASHEGAVQALGTSRELLQGLRELSGRAGATLAQTLLAALQALMSRYTGQTDVVIGAASAGRMRPELEPMIGALASTLPIRTDLSGDPSFAELLARVQAAAEGARYHQGLPFARIVEALDIERDPGRFPVFQIGFACTEPVADMESAGLVFSTEHVELPASRYDISFAAQPRGDGLWLEATYVPALFDPLTVGRLLGHLEVLLAAVVADPSARISQLPVLTGGELARELTEWNDTAVALPVVCVHEGFEAQAARTPDAIAAEFGDEAATYAELDGWAGVIAGRLRAAGVGPEVLVGVCMPAGLARLAGLLGVWKAGGGYVPLDPGLPAERLSFMMADTGMGVVLADEPGRVPADAGVRVLVVPATRPRPGELEDAGPDGGVRVMPSNVAYVMYTSGSTGQPKGVVVEHRQAVNFLLGMAGPWRIGPSSVVLQFSAFTFDVSVMDMFMPLLAGGKVVLAGAQTLHSPPRLAALIRDRRVTFACLPPAVLSLLSGEVFPDLRVLLSAGEELSSELLAGWLRDGLEIYNGYGPTEASIGATFMRLDGSTPLPPPIGRPKPNYQVYVLDGDLNPVPAGVTGELHIGGAGVARGYLNRPELTHERFIADPFRAGPGARLYKTGDLVRRRPDGVLMFAGRIDGQVKIRGLRVELGEIEAALTAHPDVAQAVVAVVTGPAGQQQLAGYLRPRDSAGPDLAGIRQQLARRLPAYMIPGSLTVLAEFPLTIHGKIDKAALPAPQAGPDGTSRVPPATLIETVLVDAYATVLGTEQAGATDSFFDAGGNSLQAMQLITALRTSLDVDLDITAIFLAPAPRQLAALLRDEHDFHDEPLTATNINATEIPEEVRLC